MSYKQLLPRATDVSTRFNNTRYLFHAPATIFLPPLRFPDLQHPAVANILTEFLDVELCGDGLPAIRSCCIEAYHAISISLCCGSINPL